MEGVVKLSTFFFLCSGLRQCVAYFFSELVKVDPSRDSSHCTACYYVSEEAGQRLQGLVNNGSVDR